VTLLSIIIIIKKNFKSHGKVFLMIHYSICSKLQIKFTNYDSMVFHSTTNNTTVNAYWPVCNEQSSMFK
jgi:hypothetical protein